jgi:hypothetical protein
VSCLGDQGLIDCSHDRNHKSTRRQLVS